VARFNIPDFTETDGASLSAKLRVGGKKLKSAISDHRLFTETLSSPLLSFHSLD
jgi:hypothetical protein